MLENFKVGLLLHFYQPWWQFPDVLDQIVAKSYKPILKLIEKSPGFCFSVNINYSLLELLQERRRQDVIFDFKKAADDSKIELLGSTAYHPIMPLIPRDVRMSHVLVDSEMKKACWGINRNCGGIFLPEMAFIQTLLPDIADYGYRWTVLDDAFFKFQYNRVPFDTVAALQGFRVYLRSNLWSNRIANNQLNFDSFQKEFTRGFSQWTKNQPAYMIIATDAETFGQHYQLMEKFLEPFVREWGKAGADYIVPIEKIGDTFPEEPLVRLYENSWAADENDYRLDNPYPLWNSKNNAGQQDLWELVNMALEYFKKPDASLDCLKITSSCAWWWISGRPWWDPSIMKIQAAKALGIIKRYADYDQIAAAQQIFKKLKNL